MPETLIALLHLLVFAYWLGGDVGAFAASFVLSDSRQPVAARLAAAKILNIVDMAPRSALILTLPTGLTLAHLRGWIEIPVEAMFAVWIAALLWLAGMWRRHLSHAQGQVWTRTDLGLRVALIVGLVAAASTTPHLFLQIKFGCLAFAVVLGLAIRIVVARMSAAIVQLAKGEQTHDGDHTIARSLSIARPLVLCIWICLLIAAWAGVAKPV